ncbi:MAG: CRISPR-associated endonuclease Cas2 [bacterium]|nr:CRISPR-associated endonuclease Cas2 [bacterium]
MDTNLQFLVVAYDIVCDRRRSRLVKLLQGYGQRVNYSVFECQIAPRTLPSLMKEIEAIINFHEDSILYYQLCRSCVRRKTGTGISGWSKPKTHVIL